MKIHMFYHSLVSDWNHGNAHFLRGVATDLIARGHEVSVWEPRTSWSARNLIQDHGRTPLRDFHRAYPALPVKRYSIDAFRADSILEQADLVLVHEWNDAALVNGFGKARRRHPHVALLFHDTHHRMVTDPESMGGYELENYDGVLAYGAVLSELYASSGRVQKTWTWHEAADTRVFHPKPRIQINGDLVWIGNWGDGERARELSEFLLEPCKALKLRARVHGVRYPEPALKALQEAKLDYAGWLPNFKVPEVFSQFRVTVHVPRRPYVETLPGIPTIRPFEALACGIPLVSSPWNDQEHLFRPGTDYLMARNTGEMIEQIRTVLNEPGLADSLRSSGLETIRRRHTCAHRAEELLKIYAEIKAQPMRSEFESPTAVEPRHPSVLSAI